MGSSVQARASATFCADFKSGLPAKMHIHGEADVDMSGGFLRLTLATNFQYGVAYVDDFNGGQPVTAFHATFKAALFGAGGGGNSPAEGFSFNLVPAASIIDVHVNPGYNHPGEEGLNDGLAISFDTFANNPGDAIAIDVKWLGQLIYRFPMQCSQSPAHPINAAMASKDVDIELRSDGTLDVTYDHTQAVINVQTPYRADVIGVPEWVLGARTSANYDNHWIADLCIQTVGSPSGPEACMDFNNGTPSGMTLFGDAQVDGGYLKLYTIGQPNSFGIAYVDDFGGGKFVQGFTATFKASLFGSTACGPNSPADGFSFNLVPAATVLASPGYAQPAEEGLAEGLAINFDTFDNGGGEAPAIEIKWLGQIIASTPFQASQSPAGATDPVTASRDVIIQLKADGKMDVSYGGIPIFSDVQTPYDPTVIGTPKWVMGARVGACNDNHWIANLCIQTVGGPGACMDFNNGIPSGIALFGDAQVDGGYLKLYTIGHPNGFGIAYLDDFSGGQLVQGFTATFKASLFGSTACGPNSPADGFSFNLVPAATVLANPGYAQPAEEGLAEGLAINFDTFDNGGGEAPAIEIKWLGQTIAWKSFQASQSPAGATDPVTASREVIIQLKAGGKMDVSYGGIPIFSDVQTPYDPAIIGAPKWVMGARAGDCNDNHWFDDLCITTTPAPGHQIPGLYNSGVDSQAVPLDYGMVDPHYQLVAATSPDAFAIPQVESPVVWLADNRVSRWISPALDTMAQADGLGTYKYSYDTTFDLTGFDPNRTRLAGRWSTDDVGLDIQINGFSISPVNSPDFTDWTPFEITSHFVSTINHLTFVVNNGVPGFPTGLDPTGLRVEVWGLTQLICPSTAASPLLTSTRQGGSLTLSWHQPGFVLQTGPTPMGPWTDLTRGASPNGVDYSTSVVASATAAFFRLRSDCP
jgi:hypothetical protein